MITKLKSNSFERLLTVSFWLYFSLKIVTPTSVTAASSFHQEVHYYHPSHTSNWKGRQIIFCIRGGGIDTDIPEHLLKGSRSDYKNNKLKNFSHVYKRLHRDK